MQCSICGNNSNYSILFIYKNEIKIIKYCDIHIKSIENLKCECYTCLKPVRRNLLLTGNNCKTAIIFCSSKCIKLYSKDKDYTNFVFKCSCGENCKFRCTGCNIMKYCSRKCQKKDWKNHKEICYI